MTEIELFIEWVLSLVSENLYSGVFLAALLETIFPPIPSEAIFPLAGYLVLQNELHFVHVIIVGVIGGIGSTIGASIIYLIALKVGRTGLYKYMSYLKIKKSSIEKAERWYEKYGDKSVLIGRLIPGIRELVSIPAGIFNMNPIKFFTYTIIGSISWSVLLTTIGYYFGVATIDVLKF